MEEGLNCISPHQLPARLLCQGVRWMETLADKIPDFPTCRWGGKIDIVIFEKETANIKGSKSCLTKVRWKPGVLRKNIRLYLEM